MTDWRQKRIDRVVESFAELDDKAKSSVLDTIRYNNALKAALEVVNTETVSFGDMYDIAEERQKWFNKFEGFGTGMGYFDDATYGFRPGEVIIVAGPSNFGKTMVALNMVVAAAVNSLKRVLIVSMEMTTIEISTRVYNLAPLEDHETLKENLHIQKVMKVSADHIEAIIKRENPDLVMIDVLQMLANQESGSEYERINAAVAKIKHIALKHNKPIILISHVAKTRSGKEGEATTMDLKGSSSIEQDCDIVIMINQTKELRLENKLILTLAKHRTKRPEIYLIPCAITFNGIKVDNEGQYEVYE